MKGLHILIISLVLGGLIFGAVLLGKESYRTYRPVVDYRSIYSIKAAKSVRNRSLRSRYRSRYSKPYRSRSSRRGRSHSGYSGGK